MQWSANKAVKLIESWGQHGTSVLYLSLRIGRTKVPGKELDYAQGGGKRKERKDEEAPSKKWEKNSMHGSFEAEEEQWYNRTTTQSHPKSSKKQSCEGSIVKQHKDSRVFGMHANKQCKCSEAIKPKTSPSTTPIPPSSPSGTRFPHRFHSHQTMKMECALTALHAHRQDPKGQE